MLFDFWNIFVMFGGKRLNYIEGGEILINLSILSLQTKEKILR